MYDTQVSSNLLLMSTHISTHSVRRQERSAHQSTSMAFLATSCSLFQVPAVANDGICGSVQVPLFLHVYLRSDNIFHIIVIPTILLSW